MVTCMSKNFLTDSNEPAALTVVQNTDEQTPDRESLRILVIGSRQSVTSTIHTLHRLRFAEVREWSPLLPGPHPGEVMSILTRYRIML